MSRTDLTDNPYEIAENDNDKIREDLNDLMREYFEKGKLSRPAFAEELKLLALTYEEFAKYTEKSGSGE